MIILLISLIIALLFSLIVVSFLLKKSMKITKSWESLFLDTVEDLEHSYMIFDELVNHRAMIANDPDVLKVRQVFAVVREILGEYIKYGKEISEIENNKRQDINQ